MLHPPDASTNHTADVPSPRDCSLIPPRWQRAVRVVVLFSVVAGAVLAAAVHGDDSPTLLDVAASEALKASPQPSTELRWFVVLVGNPVSTAVIMGVITAMALIGRWWRAAAFAIVAPGLSAALAWFLQPWIGRTLRGIFAFPSGHTVTTASVAVVAVVLMLRACSAHRWIRTLLAAAALSVPIAVAIFLVTLDLHYLTDTIGGACMSLAVVLSTALVIDALAAFLDGRSSRGRGAMWVVSAE